MFIRDEARLGDLTAVVAMVVEVVMVVRDRIAIRRSRRRVIK